MAERFRDVGTRRAPVVHAIPRSSRARRLIGSPYELVSARLKCIVGY